MESLPCLMQYAWRKFKYKMAILTQIPIGTKFKVKKTGEIITLEEIRNFPTRYKTINDAGKVEYYQTFEVEVIVSSQETD